MPSLPVWACGAEQLCAQSGSTPGSGPVGICPSASPSRSEPAGPLHPHSAQRALEPSVHSVPLSEARREHYRMVARIAERRHLGIKGLDVATKYYEMARWQRRRGNLIGGGHPAI